MGRMIRRSYAHLLVIPVVMFTLPALADGEGPDKGVVARYGADITQFRSELAAVDALYKSDFAGLNGDRFRDLRASLTDDLDALRKALDQVGKGSLDQVLGAADNSLSQVLRDVWLIYADVASKRVEILRNKMVEQQKAIEKEFSDRREAIDKKSGYGTADYVLALAQLATELRNKETTQVTASAKTYTDAENELLSHYKALVGETWKLQDFNKRRSRDASAILFQQAVYRYFCYELAARDPSFLKALFGASVPQAELDRLLQLASPWHLVVPWSYQGAYPAGKPDGDFSPTPEHFSWRMDAIFANNPVERLRQYDKLPALNFDGSDLEVMAKLLSARLVRFFTVQADQDRAFGELSDLAKAIDDASTPLPDAEAVAKAIDAALVLQGPYNDVLRNQQTWREAVERFRGRMIEARRKLDLKRTWLVVVARETGVVTKIVEPKIVNGVPEKVPDGFSEREELKKIDDRISLLKLNKLPTGDWEAKRAAVVKSVDQFVQKEQETFDKAKTDLDDAEKKSKQADADAAKLDPGPYRRAYADARSLYKAAVAALPTADAADFAYLPEKAEDFAGKDQESVKRLGTRIAEIQRARSDLRFALAEKMSDYDRNDAELRELGKAVANDRGAAVALAQKTLTDMGAKDDEFLQVFNDLKQKLDTLNKVLGTGGKVLPDTPDFMNKADREALITRLSGVLSTIAKILKFIGTNAARAKTAADIYTQIANGDATTALNGVAAILEQAASEADKIPGAGVVVGRFLGFYAQATGAANTAIVNIRKKIIEADLSNAFSTPPARHLYTQNEIEGALSRLVNPDLKRITAYVQTQRVMGLVGATNLAQAIDQRPRP